MVAMMLCENEAHEARQEQQEPQPPQGAARPSGSEVVARCIDHLRDGGELLRPYLALRWSLVDRCLCELLREDRRVWAAAERATRVRSSVVLCRGCGVLCRSSQSTAALSLCSACRPEVRPEVNREALGAFMRSVGFGREAKVELLSTLPKRRELGNVLVWAEHLRTAATRVLRGGVSDGQAATLPRWLSSAKRKRGREKDEHGNDEHEEGKNAKNGKNGKSGENAKNAKNAKPNPKGPPALLQRAEFDEWVAENRFTGVLLAGRRCPHSNLGVGNAASCAARKRARVKLS